MLMKIRFNAFSSLENLFPSEKIRFSVAFNSCGKTFSRYVFFWEKNLGKIVRFIYRESEQTLENLWKSV